MIIQHCGHPERMCSTPRGGQLPRALTSPPWAQARLGLIRGAPGLPSLVGFSLSGAASLVPPFFFPLFPPFRGWRCGVLGGPLLFCWDLHLGTRLLA